MVFDIIIKIEKRWLLMLLVAPAGRVFLNRE
jgi:hypothetical protein